MRGGGMIVNSRGNTINFKINTAIVIPSTFINLYNPFPMQCEDVN
jgi:hypothetical protein